VYKVFLETSIFIRYFTADPPKCLQAQNC